MQTVKIWPCASLVGNLLSSQRKKVRLPAHQIGLSNASLWLAFKACRDPLGVGAFFFTRRILSPPLDKRNTRNKAKDLCITSERHIGVSWACDALAP